MTVKQQLSAQQDTEFARRAMQLLSDRIALSKRDELLDYFDALIPKYEMPVVRVGYIASKRKNYDWSEFLEFSGDNFVRYAYLCIVKREADDAALNWAAAELGADDGSRIIFLWRLLDSEEGRGQATKIRGLWPRYRYHLARLEQKPFRARLFHLLLKLESLSRSRMDGILVSQRREITEYGLEISRLETRLVQHYNDTLSIVKYEVGEALTPDINR